MGIIKDIGELLEANVISPETADRILNFYESRKSNSQSRLFIAFGILGAILIGLGIILILAHNWDELSRATKTIISFLPLLIGQVICGYVLLKKMESTAWRESSAAFLFFTVGASISLISQIYNIPGDVSSFILTWMLLCLPLVYLLKSSIVSLLYLIGITAYAVETGYGNNSNSNAYWYWLLILLILPHYFQLLKNKAQSNFTLFHNWMLPLSVSISLGMFAKDFGEIMMIAYCSLFGLFYLIGNLKSFRDQNILNNGYRSIGALGTIGLLLAASFDGFWKELRESDLQFFEVLLSPEFIVAALITIAATALLVLLWKSKDLNRIKPVEFVFLFFIIIFVIGLYSSVSVLLINLLVFVIGVLTIKKGADSNHLGILNYGLLIITALVLCRFFDTDLSFVLRGILFIAVGIGFFLVNYWMLKKRKSDG